MREQGKDLNAARLPSLSSDKASRANSLVCLFQEAPAKLPKLARAYPSGEVVAQLSSMMQPHKPSEGAQSATPAATVTGGASILARLR